MRTSHLVLGFFLLGCSSLLGACSMTVDTEILQDDTEANWRLILDCKGDTPKMCPVSENPDDGYECVGLFLAERGCGRTACDACGLNKADAVCSPDGECKIAACFGTWENCDKVHTNGCEVDLATDPNFCGDCETSCEGVIKNGVAACASGKCSTQRCLTGFKSCDGNLGNGCEVDVRVSKQHCGECDNPCSGECVDGVCQE